jgi:hypothetical protein
MQINKNDRNDAIGIARIMQAGWYKEVRVKGLESHAIKALLTSRALLVKIKRDIENQIRGLLKNFGLVIGRAKMSTFTLRAQDLLDDRPELAAAVEPLLRGREAIGRQIVDLDRKVRRLARASAPPDDRRPASARSRRCAIWPPSMIPAALTDHAMSAPISASRQDVMRPAKSTGRGAFRNAVTPCYAVTSTRPPMCC